MTSPKQKIKIALSIDFDAISGWLGTGTHPSTTTSDLSSGYFSAHVGVPRLLRLFSTLNIASNVTWCLPGHSIETFPQQAKDIVSSGAEIALHGYCHEGSDQLTAEQERDVLEKTIGLVQGLTGGKWPRGYRAPLYRISERTIELLGEKEFLWDSSLSHLDCEPYLLPKRPDKIDMVEYGEGKKAGEWMKPTKDFMDMEKGGVVEIPCNWYMEDMTPLQFFPNVPNSAGYVDVRVVENMWKDRFTWLRSEIDGSRKDKMTVFALVIHPDTSGMAHVIGMVKRFLEWLLEFGDEVEFVTYSEIAEEFKKGE